MDSFFPRVTQLECNVLRRKVGNGWKWRGLAKIWRCFFEVLCAFKEMVNAMNLSLNYQSLQVTCILQQITQSLPSRQMFWHTLVVSMFWIKIWDFCLSYSIVLYFELLFLDRSCHKLLLKCHRSQAISWKVKSYPFETAFSRSFRKTTRKIPVQVSWCPAVIRDTLLLSLTFRPRRSRPKLFYFSQLSFEMFMITTLTAWSCPKSLTS